MVPLTTEARAGAVHRAALALGRLSAARALSDRAFERYRALEGMEEGEAEVFLSRIEVLRASGDNDEALRVEQNLEVDMWGAAWIPARVDRGEARLTLGIGELRTAQEGLPARRDAVIALTAIAGIHAETVGMPEIDADAFYRRTVRGGNHLKGKRK